MKKSQNPVDDNWNSFFQEDEFGIFEEDTVLLLLEQLEDDLNFLTIRIFCNIIPLISTPDSVTRARSSIRTPVRPGR